jgi:predicted Abi (CAAX) family protease
MKSSPVLTGRKPGSHHLYHQAEFNQTSFYPVQQSLPPELYQPIAPWMGRLILPALEQRWMVKGVLLEVYHAPQDYEDLVGQVVNLRWSDEPKVQARVWTVTRHVHFSPQAEKTSKEGMIHPERLNHWRLVNPLESLAGLLPEDEVVVKLREPVEVDRAGEVASLYITRDPIQISGRYYALVKFLGPCPDEADLFQVAHYNRASGQFDGPQEVIWLPPVAADVNTVIPSISRDIEKSPPNELGWYIYGAQDRQGRFVVQALAPRALLRLQPDEVIFGTKPGMRYINKSWSDVPAQKGRVSSVLICPEGQNQEAAISQWREGDHLLLVHVYGGIGGKKAIPAMRSGIYFGHFAYGEARVVREPLADELCFDIDYHQIYTSNMDGVIPGALSWVHYVGDRQWGWLGQRPVCDLLVKLPALTDPYNFFEEEHSALNEIAYKLEMTAARYRIGDGTGGTYVSLANNCAQDANQALYQAIRDICAALRNYPRMPEWQREYPDQAARLERLVTLGQDLKRFLMPFRLERPDWKYRIEMLGISLETHPIRNLLRGLTSWRTMLPRVAGNSLARIFFKHDACIWVLRTNQVAGDPDIDPVVPLGF